MHSGGKTIPFQPAGYWVWLENCTAFSGQTSTPARRMGKTAAELPAWPKTTWDWMDKTFFMLASFNNQALCARAFYIKGKETGIACLPP